MNESEFTGKEHLVESGNIQSTKQGVDASLLLYSLLGVRIDVSGILSGLTSFTQVVHDQLTIPFAKTLEIVGRGLRELVNTTVEVIRQSEIVPALMEAMKEIEEQERAVRDELYPELAKRGWYIHDGLLVRDIALLVRYVKERQGVGLEHFMVRIGTRRTGEIRRAVSLLWPDRYPILSDAFDAHADGLYSLCIPTFLAQLEGISNDIFEISIFAKRKKDGLPKTIEKAEQIRDGQASDSRLDRSFDDSLLSPLERLSSVASDVKDWEQLRASDASVGSLNRHAVMHGLDVTYPSLENSLRCIMMLDFLRFVQSAWIRYQTKHSPPP